MNQIVLIVGAMQHEIDGFLAAASEVVDRSWNGVPVFTARLADAEVVIAKSGVGKVLAAAVLQYLIGSYQPKCIIFAGVAGALNPAYEVGDIVVGRDYIQHDYDATALGFARGELAYTGIRVLEADPKLLALASSYTSGNQRLHIGRILTGDQFISASELATHRYLTEELAGDAIEMEGASAALVAHINQVPFIALRTISDKANADAPSDFVKLMPQVVRNSVGVVIHMLSNSN